MNLAYNPLPQQQSDALKEWLKKPEFETLVTALQNRVMAVQVAQANEALDAVIQRNDAVVVERAISMLQEAADIRRAINLLRQIRDGKFQFQTATAVPTN